MVWPGSALSPGFRMLPTPLAAAVAPAGCISRLASITPTTTSEARPKIPVNLMGLLAYGPGVRRDCVKQPRPDDPEAKAPEKALGLRTHFPLPSLPRQAAPDARKQHDRDDRAADNSPVPRALPAPGRPRGAAVGPPGPGRRAARLGRPRRPRARDEQGTAVDHAAPERRAERHCSRGLNLRHALDQHARGHDLAGHDSDRVR